MRIAICDDCESELNTTKDLLSRYINDNKLAHIEIDSFSSPFPFLDSSDHNPYDVVLLDICMPNMLGTDIARELRQRNSKSEIIFLTVSSEYALEAFAVKALHYVLKPIDKVIFYEAMDRACKAFFTRSASNSIIIKLKNGLNHVIIDDISYVECNSHENIIHFISNESDITRETLTSIYEKIESVATGQFILPCKGYIVNQKHIRKITSVGIYLKSGAIVPIAGRNLRNVMNKYFIYMFGE